MPAAADAPRPEKGTPADKAPQHITRPPKYVVQAPSLRPPSLEDMPCYLLMMKLTEHGARDARNGHVRYRQLAKLVTDLQGHVAFFLMTLGPTDYASAVFLPDDECAMILTAQLTELGCVTTMTMKSFDVVEMWECRNGKPK
jgi:uncharacterized protein with GYD domain